MTNTTTKQCQGCGGEFSSINVIFKKENLDVEKMLCDNCLKNEDVDLNTLGITKATSEEILS